jgi:hypothetical protein
MSEINEEYVPKHGNSFRCEKRFCAKCLSLQIFRATGLNTVYYRCEECDAMQKIEKETVDRTPVRAVPSRRFATIPR